MEPVSLPSPALAGGFSTTNATWEAPISIVQKSKCYIYIFFFNSFSLWFITGCEYSSLCYAVGLVVYPSYI